MSNAIFYSTQVDVHCGDCNKDYADIWAQVGGGYVCWTCPDCGYEHEGSSNA